MGSIYFKDTGYFVILKKSNNGKHSEDSSAALPKINVVIMLIDFE